MKLDKDCVRSVLLELEEKLTLNDFVYLYQIEQFDTVKEYGFENTVYAISKLIQAKYIDGDIQRGDGEICAIIIPSITWEGHLFLDDIRDSKIWSMAKDATKSLASTSLSIMALAAKEAVKKQIGL